MHITDWWVDIKMFFLSFVRYSFPNILTFSFLFSIAAEYWDIFFELSIRISKSCSWTASRPLLKTFCCSPRLYFSTKYFQCPTPLMEAAFEHEYTLFSTSSLKLAFLASSLFLCLFSIIKQGTTCNCLQFLVASTRHSCIRVTGLVTCWSSS